MFHRVPATCLIMRLPYPVPPNRFRYIRGWMLPPAVSSHATPRKGAQDPKNTPRSNAPPSPVFLGNNPPAGLRHPYDRFVITARHCVSVREQWELQHSWSTVFHEPHPRDVCQDNAENAVTMMRHSENLLHFMKFRDYPEKKFYSRKTANLKIKSLNKCGSK